MKITVFVFPGCPYCIQMKKILNEVMEERPELKKLELCFIDETAEPELAGQMDYYYCPSFFREEEKLYEARPGRPRAEAKRMIAEALSAFEA